MTVATNLPPSLKYKYLWPEADKADAAGALQTAVTSSFTVPTTDINAVYLPHLENEARVQIFYGGSSSGKSVFLAQRAIIDVLLNTRNYLICRKIARTIRNSVFKEITKIIDGWDLNGRFNVNKSEMSITADNGYQILFAGLDDAEKLKSITPQKDAFTDVWIEEATESDPDDIKQLLKRQRGGRADVPKRLTLSFNPILQLHHIYQTYFAAVAWADDQTEYTADDGRLTILKTWYIHNRFLTPDDVYDLENETDEYFKDVYTYGNWGVLGDVIFTNWEMRDLSGMRNDFTNHRFGLDFGFSADPTAVPLTHYDRPNKTIYIYDELYEYAATNDVLAAMLKPLVGGYPLKCDSAEAKSIHELRQYGIAATGAVKGKDSIWHGIQWLKQQKIIIDKRCINIKNEFQQYQWSKDKHGNSTNIPVDKFNNAIDALRYAYEQDMRGERKKGRSHQW
jgi:phage terminase large subunit